MKWKDRAVQLREAHSWTETYRQIRKEYPRLDKTDGQIRDAVRWRTRDRAKPKEPVDIHETLKKLLQKEQQLKQLTEATRCTERMVLAAIEDLKDEGIQIIETGGKYKICKDVIPQENHFDVDWKGDKIIRFGLMGDPQFNSKYCQITHLHNYYDICEQEGIKTVYNTGDIDEGEEMRQGHKYECYNQGADDHVEEIVKNYPKRDGIVTEFITGNHDHSLIKRAGLDIGKSIEKERPDMKYLGMSAAVINLTPNCTLELRHPIDGTCFDDKTEILTQRGWVFFNELNTNDYVATMTKSEHEFQWQQPEFITKQQYKGYLYHIKARLIDMMVTPNHGLWVRRSTAGLGWQNELKMPQKSHRRHNTDWHMETAEEVCENQFCRQRWQMTNACSKWIGEIHSDKYTVPYVESKNNGMKDRMVHIGEVDLMDFCELVAWYVTEGYADKKRVSICQDEIVNPDNHKRITNLLDRMNIPYSVSGRNNKNIDVRSVELAKCLIDICGKGSRNKRIPRFFKDLPTKYLRIMFDTMILGDGWVNGKAFGYRSISQKLRDSMTEIAIKLGYSVTENKDTVQIATIQIQPTINEKPQKTHYDGMVYCCKVPNELILVRRNGKATWSHNSYAISYKTQKMIDAMSGGEKPNILAIGHYHKAEYIFYRNIHSFQTGCFQAQTNWMKGRQIAAMVGGWIVEVHVEDDGTIARCKGEFIPYYKMLKDDYKNWR